MTRAGFATNELLGRLGLLALLLTALIPAMGALRDALAAEPPLTGWQVAGAVAWGLAKGVLPLAAVIFVVIFTVIRAVTFRPGTGVRITDGPWAGAKGVVAADHDSHYLGPVTVVFHVDGVERRERLSPFHVRNWWIPRWLWRPAAATCGPPHRPRV